MGYWAVVYFFNAEIYIFQVKKRLSLAAGAVGENSFTWNREKCRGKPMGYCVVVLIFRNKNFKFIFLALMLFKKKSLNLFLEQLVFFLKFCLKVIRVLKKFRFMWMVFKLNPVVVSFFYIFFKKKILIHLIK